MAEIPPSNYHHLLEHPSSSSDSEDNQSHDHQHLQDSLKRLETFLRFLGFFHNSPLTLSISSLTFLLIGIAAPSLVIVFFYCSSSSSTNCKTYHVKNFEIEILIGQVSAAGVSLLCVSRYVRKYGLTNFLFVDKCFGSSSLFQDQYVRKVDISSIVQVVGVIICLHAAAKISNRAKGLVSFASKWHAQTTCNSNETNRGVVANGGNVNAAYLMGDFESADYELRPSNMEYGTNISSYQKRQAFVQYLQSNPGGVTIFGWTVDRTLMDTIFSIELSVVTFVLGKTISFSTRAP